MIRSRSSRERARQVLEMFGITEPPVNVGAIAERLGFIVAEHEFPEDTSAVLIIEPDLKAIGVNADHATVRQRFSVAHELGHFMHGHEDYSPRKSGETIKVEHNYNWNDPHQRMEIEANEFAAELLMPEPMLRRDLAASGALDVPALARRYQVSEQALWIQLMDTKLAAQYAGR